MIDQRSQSTTALLAPPAVHNGPDAGLAARVELLELVMGASNEGLWDWDLVNNEVTFSPRWKEMLGYADGEIPNRLGEWKMRVHPDDLEPARTAIQAYLSGERDTYEFEHRLQHKDGSYRWICARGIVARDADGRPVRFVGSHADITERKQIEHDLLRRDAIFAAVTYAAERFLGTATWEEVVDDVLAHLGRAANVSRVYVFENHPGDRGRLGTTIRHEWVAPDVAPLSNDPRYYAHPYTPDGFGRLVDIFRHGDSAQGHVRDLPATERPEVAALGTLSYVLVPIFVEGEWWGFIGFDECTRERNFSDLEQDALRAAADTLGAAIGRARAGQAAARLAAIVESSDDAIIGMDLAGDITSWNPGAERLFGYQATEAIGKSIAILLPAEARAQMPATLAQVERGNHYDLYDTERIRRDGSRVPVSVAISSVRDASGALIGMSSIYRNISAQKQIEQDLRRRDAIFEAVTFAAEQFLRGNTTWEDAADAVLARLGRATDVSRVYVFENYLGDDGAPWATQRYEWVASGITPQIDNPFLQAMPYRVCGWNRWEELLSRGEIVHGHAREFPEAEQPEVCGQDVQSIVVVPIYVEGEWWGFIGFDECTREREFSDLERDALKAAADTLGAAIGRSRAEQESARLTALVESSDDAIIGATPDGIITSWNPGATRLFGYSTDEIIGQSIAVLLPPDHHMQMREMLGDLACGTHCDFYETDCIRKDGTVVSVSATLSSVYDANGTVTGSSAIVRDITERKLADAALRESQRKLATLFSNQPGMAYSSQNDANWTMAFVSDGGLDLTGYTPEELGDNSRVAYADLIHPDDQIWVWRDIQSAVAADVPYRLTYRIRTASGAEKGVMEQGRGVRDDDGALICREGFIADVTDRVQARQLLEQRVAERTRELATLLDVSVSVASTLELAPLLELVLDQLRAVVDYCGASLCTLDGDELVIVAARSSNPDLRDDELRGMRLRLADGVPIWDIIQRHQAVVIDNVRDDSELARAYRSALGDRFEAVARNIRSWLAVPLAHKGNLLGILTFSYQEQDVDTRHHADLAMALANQAALAIENARLYEQVQNQAALEERQRLARELHDSVSQALFGIGLGARTARTLLDQEPSKATAPLDYVLSLAEAGLAEMRALIFELRPESLAEEGLVAALEKQAASLRTRHGLLVETDLGPEPEIPLERKEVLYRIAQEALHNTIKHARARTVTICLAATPHTIDLVLSDDGNGFDPAGNFPGHLGLRSMRERVERIGGTFGVASAPGDGTRIQVSIPS